MKLNFNNDEPLFQQLADELINAIISGALQEEEKIPSVSELSLSLQINPQTVTKATTILVDKEIIYKKRGLGMFVVKGIREKLLMERKKKFYDSYLTKVIEEANRLHMTKEEIIELINGGMNDD